MPAYEITPFGRELAEARERATLLTVDGKGRDAKAVILEKLERENAELWAFVETVHNALPSPESTRLLGR